MRQLDARVNVVAGAVSEDLPEEGDRLVAENDVEVLRLGPDALDRVRVRALDLLLQSRLVRARDGRVLALDDLVLVLVRVARRARLGVLDGPDVAVSLALAVGAHAVVGDGREALLGVCGRLAEPEERAEEEVVEADGCRHERVRRTVRCTTGHTDAL